MKVFDFTPFEEDPQGAYGPAPIHRGEPDFRDQVRRVDELIDSRSVPTTGARTGKTPKGSQGEVKFKTPVTDQTPYRSKYTDYRHPSPPLMIGMIRPPNLMVN